MMRILILLFFVVSIASIAYAEDCDTDSPSEVEVTRETAKREFTAGEIAFFTEKVEPVLKRRCYRCHTNKRDPKGDLALNSREEILIGGYGGPGAVPGKPKESMIFKSLDAPRDSLIPQMPPRGGKLPEKEVELIKKWIEMDLPHRN